MRPKRAYSESGALVPRVQAEHRRDAVQYAIASIHEAVAQADEVFPEDELFSQLSVQHREWVVETLYQGAYLREYHLWEKECKEYFSSMAKRNYVDLNLKSNGFPSEVERALVLFSAASVLPEVQYIREMNARVRIMKHAPGVLTEHFVTTTDYGTAHAAIVRFWEALMALEEVDYTK
ncbi:MAG: hypothetical protein QE484_03815 [Rhizobium sp.]|nr:hypothetical protein [Rhizobium sp.]